MWKRQEGAGDEHRTVRRRNERGAIEEGGVEEEKEEEERLEKRSGEERTVGFEKREMFRRYQRNTSTVSSIVRRKGADDHGRNLAIKSVGSVD